MYDEEQTKKSKIGEENERKGFVRFFWSHEA
jgi:hypothetical protein